MESTMIFKLSADDISIAIKDYIRTSGSGDNISANDKLEIEYNCKVTDIGTDFVPPKGELVSATVEITINDSD